jgi:hypothetical protein
MRLWCQNDRMTRRFALLPWRVSAFVITLLIPATTRIAAYQSPVQQSGQRSANDLKLTAAEEKDSFEIYSMLLRTELPSEWNITGWAIEQETQTYPTFGVMSSIAECLQPSKNQESIYRPLIDDYVAKNKGKLVLERKFASRPHRPQSDLPAIPCCRWLSLQCVCDLSHFRRGFQSRRDTSIGVRGP